MLSIYRDKRLVVYRFGELIAAKELETFRDEIYMMESNMPNFYTKLLVDFSRTEKVNIDTSGIAEFGTVASMMLSKRSATVYVSCFAPTPLTFGYARMAEMSINSSKVESLVVSDYETALRHIGIQPGELHLI